MARTLAEIDVALATIETALGDLTKTIDQWRAGPNPPELQNHFYPIFKSLQQIYDSENSLNAEVAALKEGASTPPPPAPVVIPAPVGDLVHIGGDASPSAAEVNYAQAMLSVSAGSLATGGDAAILFTARSPIVSHIMYATGGDRGWRFWYNMKPVGPNQLAASDPTLGQIAHQYEQDGSVSYTYYKPQLTPAGPFDNLPGKSLTIYPGGFNTAQTGKYVDVGGGQAGRGLRFGVTVSGINNPTPMVRLDPNGAANPVAVYADGALQQVLVKTINGVKVFAPA